MRPKTKRETWHRHLMAIFFPERCACCGEVIAPLTECCLPCRESLPLNLPPLCPYCGRAQSVCDCHHLRRQFDACTAPFFYEGPVRRSLLRLKYQPDFFTVEFLAGKMAQCVRRDFREPLFDCIVPVPVSDKRLSERGYNQSDLLAEELAKHLSLPVCHCLAKIYDTASQKDLSESLRTGNVLGAFDVGDCLPEGKRILLLDDILTTGSTMNECAKMLKIYGALSVVAVVAAVNPPRKKKEETHEP